MSNRFGIIFDIDGVLRRGRKMIPVAKDAVNKIIRKCGKLKFKVPVLFVTNAGNSSTSDSALQLSRSLGVKIDPKQIMMSYTPLKRFTNFHDRHVLVTGQGAVTEIARSLGFKRVTSIEWLRTIFPLLDVVDLNRRPSLTRNCEFAKNFSSVEAIILFGEPIRWETSLQLIVDLLVSNGHPNNACLSRAPYPHIPVIACNADLVWQSEVPSPRLAHGCFLLCLESLYKKLTGYELEYSVISGKPNPITYEYSYDELCEQASEMGFNEPLERVYCIGDNPEVDIYGANYYNHRLKGGLKEDISLKASEDHPMTMSRLPQQQQQIMQQIHTLSRSTVSTPSPSFIPILVRTGVYNGDDRLGFHNDKRLNFHHRDLSRELDCRFLIPHHICQNVLEAVEYILEREKHVS